MIRTTSRGAIMLVASGVSATLLASFSLAQPQDLLPDANQQNALLFERKRQLEDNLSLGNLTEEARSQLRAKIALVNEVQHYGNWDVDSIVRCTATPYIIAEAEPKIFEKNTAIICKEIYFEDNSTIRVPKGTVLYLRADTIRVGRGARIDGDGAKGGKGDRGPPVTGEWSSQGDKDYWVALGACRGNPSSPERGGKGVTGKDGKHGARVVISVHGTPIDVPVSTRGGEGGDGGDGGDGRLLKNGRQNYCDGCTMNCPSGPQGDPGKAGNPGLSLYLQES